GLCDAGGLSERLPQSVGRPAYFFSKTSELPERAVFQLELPASLATVYGLPKSRRMIRKAAARHETEAQEEVRRRNWRVRGPTHCIRISPFRRAKAYEVFGAREPTFAVLGGGKALYTVAASQLRAFRASYRAALEQW